MKIKLPSKKILLNSTIILLTTLFFTLIITNILFTKKLFLKINSLFIKENESIAVINASVAESAPIYTLYECSGKIGIFDSKTNVLIDIIDVFVSTLPIKDRISLKEGLDVYSLKELTEIIVDLTT